jgi:hypothetical protein
MMCTIRWSIVEIQIYNCVLPYARKLQRYCIMYLKKCVAHPQEVFKFEILHRASLIRKYDKYLKRCYPTEFADSTQNHHKIIEKPIQSIRTKVFPIIVCLVPSNCKEQKPQKKQDSSLIQKTKTWKRKVS